MSAPRRVRTALAPRATAAPRYPSATRSARSRRSGGLRQPDHNHGVDRGQRLHAHRVCPTWRRSSGSPPLSQPMTERPSLTAHALSPCAKTSALAGAGRSPPVPRKEHTLLSTRCPWRSVRLRDCTVRSWPVYLRQGEPSSPCLRLLTTAED